eukprot:3201261-Pleurochrysis_carterae.AAC.2
MRKRPCGCVICVETRRLRIQNSLAAAIFLRSQLQDGAVWNAVLREWGDLEGNASSTSGSLERGGPWRISGGPQLRAMPFTLNAHLSNQPM